MTRPGMCGMLSAAELTLAQHRPDGTPWRPGLCARCLPDRTCPLLAWARAVLDGGR